LAISGVLLEKALGRGSGCRPAAGTSEVKLTQNRANEFLAVIALYRALGGGWQNDLEPATSQNPNTPGMKQDAVK
jgi:hypothetical protein